MGAWGKEPYANDTAADWFYEAMEKPLPAAIAEGLQSPYEEIVRAAAFLLERVAYGYVYPSAVRTEHITMAIEKLETMIESEWILDWKEPAEIKAALQRQIAGLKVRLDRTDETVLGRLLHGGDPADPGLNRKQAWQMIAEAVRIYSDAQSTNDSWRELAEAVEERAREAAAPTAD